METTSSISITGTSSAMYSYPSLVSVTVTETRIEVIKRATPNFTYTVMGPNSRPADNIWKEVWEVENGKLVQRENIQGHHIPGGMFEEKMIWPT